MSKSFGYRQILKAIDLSLLKDQLTLLLGRNGSGKTTLLKIIAGLSRPSAGRVLFRGENIGEDPESYRASIGLISHQLGFYGELTASENLDFFGKLGKKQGRSGRIRRSLERTGLDRFADLPVKTFSSGMGKRLNIARLMVLEPEILLLDEPYTGLDHDSTRFFNDYLAEFKAGGGAALMITHQIETCFELCETVAILENQGLAHHFAAAEHSRETFIALYHRLTR